MPLDSRTLTTSTSVDPALNLQFENLLPQGHDAEATGDPNPTLLLDPVDENDPQLLDHHHPSYREQELRDRHHTRLVTSGIIRIVSLNNRLAPNVVYAPKRDPLTGEFTAVRLCVDFRGIGQPSSPLRPKLTLGNHPNPSDP